MKSMDITIVLLVVSCLPLSMVNSRCYTCPEQTIDFEGNDIGKVDAADWETCGRICSINSRCKFWTFRTSDKKCFMKDTDSGLEKKSGRISGTNRCTKAGDGPRRCDSQNCPDKGISFTGSDIGGSYETNWQSCARVCKASGTCNYWTFKESSKYCYLKSSGAGLEYWSGRISGKKTCGAWFDFKMQ